MICLHYTHDIQKAYAMTKQICATFNWEPGAGKWLNASAYVSVTCSHPSHQLIHQRLCNVLSCLCDNACKRSIGSQHLDKAFIKLLCNLYKKGFRYINYIVTALYSKTRRCIVPQLCWKCSWQRFWECWASVHQGYTLNLKRLDSKRIVITIL